MNTCGLVTCLMLTFFVSCSAFSDLKNAFDAAHMRLVADGTFQSLSSTDPFALQVSDCFATSEFYPYPAQPTGALKNVLAKRTVIVGSITDSTLYFNTTGDPAHPSGWGIALINRIFSMISTNYGVQLTLQWVYFDTSFDCFAALKNGQVDIALPNFSLGAFWNGTRRIDTFEPTCSIFGSQTNIYAKANGPYQNLDQLKARGAQLKIATSGAGSAFAAQASFPLANVTDFATFTAAEVTVNAIFDAVRAGQYDISFDNDPVTPSDVAGLTRIDSHIISTVGGFFKKDSPSCPTSAPSTCGQGNTVNINFAGILSSR